MHKKLIIHVFIIIVQTNMEIMSKELMVYLSSQYDKTTKNVTKTFNTI